MWKGYFDGACPNGNKSYPGPTRIGAILYYGEETIWTISANSGIGTVNTAEYNGLIALLEAAIAHKVQELEVFGDSQLIIYQMNRKYRVKQPHLKMLYQKAVVLSSRIPKVRYSWIPRDLNTVADVLSKTHNPAYK